MPNNFPSTLPPSASCLISAEDRRLAALHDASARALDDLDNLARFGTTGGDVPRLDNLPQAATSTAPDALAVLRDSPELPAFRTSRRFLGVDFAAPVPYATDLSSALPPPGDTAPATGRDLWSLRDFTRQHYPSGDWEAVETFRADGTEHCGWCARQIAQGRKMAVLIHPANDLVLRTCLPCSTGLQDRPLDDAGEHPEARRLSGYSDRITLARLRDPSLWRFNRDRTFGLIHLGQDVEVAILRLPDGKFELTITTPDNYTFPEVMGTYASIGEVQCRAIEYLMAWEAKG